MKIIKLLLIGLLSVVALSACGNDTENDSVTPTPPVPTQPSIEIVGLDGLAPVMYLNADVGLKAIDNNGEDVTVTWTLTENTGATLTVNNPTKVASIKITSATAKGIITIKANGPDDEKLTDTFTIVPSDATLTGLTIEGEKVVLLEGNIGTSQLKAIAAFSDLKTIDVTKFASWSFPEDTLGVIVDNTTKKGLVTASVIIDAPGKALTVAYIVGAVTDKKATAIITSKNVPKLQSFTVTAPTENLDKVYTSLVIGIKEKREGSAEEVEGDPADYSCRVITGSSVVVVGGFTCDKLKTGLAGTKGESTIEVTHSKTTAGVSKQTVDITTTVTDTIEPPDTTSLKIIGMNNGAPELYLNTSVQIQVVGDGIYGDTIDWKVTDEVDVELNSSYGGHNVMVKVKSANAKGTITATLTTITGKQYIATYEVVPSTIPLKELTVTPNEKVIELPDATTQAYEEFKARARFDDNVSLDVTTDASWSFPAGTTKLTVDERTGKVTATTDLATVPIVLTATLQSGSVTETSTSSVSSKVAGTK